VIPGDTDMQSRNLRPAPSRSVTRRGTVHVESLGDHPPSECPREVPGAGEAGPAAADRQETPPAPATADSQVTAPAPAATGQLPPDQPRPPEPAAPPPPAPAELPKRKADPSRPSVPTSRTRWPGPTPAVPRERPGRPEPAGDSSPHEPSSAGPSSAGPSSAEPSSPPLPPELFHRLWWQERADPAAPSQPSPEPEQPGPSPSDPRPPAEPSRGAVLATRVRLWLQRRLGPAQQQ
jgi:hypothetical protein